MTKHRSFLQDLARSAGGQAASALEAVEAAICASESEGALVRETAALVMLALGEYNRQNGFEVVFREFEDLDNLAKEID